MKCAMQLMVVALGLMPLSACLPTGEPKACRDLAEKECKADERCVWDSAASPAVCKDKASQQQQKTVYLWKKLKLPHENITDYVQKFAVSGDNKHLYIRLDSGFYYSGDKGEGWRKFDQIEAKAGPSAPSNIPCIGPADSIDDIKPTQHGVVVKSSRSVCLMKGDTPLWGIKQNFNYDTIVEDGQKYRVPGFKSQSILFVDVADINGVETIVFGQSPDASTHYNVWLKRTDNGDLPKLVPIKKDDGTAFMGPNTMSWMHAGNAHNGDLLLASVSGAQGVWHIPKANLPGGSTWAACPGCVLQNEPVLFPEGAAAAWNGDATSPQDNVRIMVVGSFEHAGNHHYFAGMEQKPNNTLGGLAHHQNAQGFAHALISFQNTSILGLTKYAGKTRLRTKQGIKGIASDCAPKADEDILLSAFAQNKDHMMEDGKAALPFADVSSDQRLQGVYGTDDLSWYFVDKDPAGSILDKDPMAGIFRREKKQGQPRQ